LNDIITGDIIMLMFT